MEWMTVLLLGFALGMRHATDADHVVAVTTIVGQQRKLSTASLIGVVWGAGHTITIFGIGCAIIYLKLEISARIGLSMEFSVGAMIVVLGVWSLMSFLRRDRSHAHRHGGHERTNDPEPNAASIQRKGRSAFVRPFIRPLVVGLVHGMAGSAAVSLLVLEAIPDQQLAFVYLLIFGLGTVAGMMLITLGLGLPYLLTRSLTFVHRWLGIATSVFSIGFGLFIMVKLGIGNGLFTDHPVWTPE